MITARRRSNTSRRQPVVWTFCLLSGLFASGYGVIFTVLDDYRNLYGIGEGALGAVVGIGFFSSFFAQVLLGPLADRGHARRLIYVGIAFNVVGLLMMAFGESLSAFLLGRTVMGLGIGSAHPAMRRIVILANRDSIGDSLGKLLAADVTGFALGPALSAVMVPTLGLASPFLLTAALSVASVALVVRVRVAETRVTTSERFAFDLLANRPYAGAVVMSTAVFIMIGTFDALWVLVLDDLGASDLIANAGITLFALPMLFLAARGGRMAQRLGPFRVGAVGLVAGAVFMLLYGFMPSGEWMVVVVGFHAIGDGLTVASTGIAAGMVVPAERQAGAQGLLGGAQTLTGGIVAIGAGFLFEAHGRTVTYAACACLMVATVGLGLWLAGSARSIRAEAAPAAAF